MAEPRQWAERMEGSAQLPDGDAERFAGYGVMSLPFASGHVLALRRFPASSVGPGFTSVWHRSPDGAWTFYCDVPPVQCCPRYFGETADQGTLTPVHLAWTSDRDLTVTIGSDTRLDWEMTLAPTLATRLLNAMGAVIPEPLWRRRWLLAVMGRMAGPLLGAGRMRLYGRTPNHQWFVVNPRLIWTISKSRASLGGHNLGPPASLSQQARLADFWIPQRGLFAVGRAFLEPFDAARHVVPFVTVGHEAAVPAAR